MCLGLIHYIKLVLSITLLKNLYLTKVLRSWLWITIKRFHICFRFDKKDFQYNQTEKTKFKYNLNTSKKTNISNIIKALNKISNKENKTIHVKPPPGYDIQPDKRSLNKKISKNLYNSLQKTYWWYSKNI